MFEGHAEDLPGRLTLIGCGGAGLALRSVKPAPWEALARLGGRGSAPESDSTQVSRVPARAGAVRLGLLVASSPKLSLIGTFFPVDAGATVGRGGEASVRIEDEGISRLHLCITRTDDGTFVAEDQGSTNGTYLNGARIRSAVLAEGDRLQLGAGTEIVFGRRTAGSSEEARLRQALGAAGAAAWEWAAGSGALMLSGGMARDLATPAADTEPCSRDFWSSVHEGDRAAVRARLARALEDAGPCELECRFLRRDGAIAWVALRGEVMREATGRGARITGTAMDVTGRRRAEEEMRRQSLLLDSLSDGVVALDFDGTVLDWNARAEQIFGFTRAQVLRRPLAEVFPLSQDLAAGVVRRARAGAREPEEHLLRRRDGSEVAVEVTALPLRDADGRQLASVAVLRDVDERRRMAAQLQVAERLASLGTLAAGMAHEINNPLAFMGTNLHWLRNRLEQVRAAFGTDWEDVECALADTEQGAQRIHQIVQDLKMHASAPSAGSTCPDTTADPNAAMEFALRVAENDLRPKARLMRDLGPVPAVKGSRTQLGQVFLNLLLNAAQAIPEGSAGTNEIRVRSRYDAPGNVVVFEVEDTGSGITPDVLPHIFDPFFTTKQAGKGTGLGLFICHGIVTAIGGDLVVESHVGRGSLFRIALPLARAVSGGPAAAGDERGGA